MGNSPASEFYMPKFRNTLNTRFLKSSHSSYLPAYKDGTECSETSAYKIQTPGNYPEESTQHSKQDESLKPRIGLIACKKNPIRKELQSYEKKFSIFIVSPRIL